MKALMRRWLHLILIAILGGLAVFSLVYILRVSLSPPGGIDFHSYWYSGLFLRQGTDPYTAYLRQAEPETPVQFLDLPQPVAGEIAQPGLANVPANTAPVVFLLSVFSFFSWPAAKILWLGCNLAFLLLIPLLITRWLQQVAKLDSWAIIALGLLVFALFGARNSAVNGQTSLFVYALMLVCMIYAERSPWGSGIALGVALSKYSLSLPVFLLFLIERRWKALAAALFFQLVALLAISAYTGQSPLAILAAYREIMLIHTSMPGIHIAGLFPPSSAAGTIYSILFTVIVLAVLLAAGLRRKSGKLVLDVEILQGQDRLLFDILVLWTLLVAYHRAYDSFLAITPLFSAGLRLMPQDTNPDSRSWRIFAAGGVALGAGVLILPASGFPAILARIGIDAPLSWGDIHNALITVVLLALTAASVFRLLLESRQPPRW